MSQAAQSNALITNNQIEVILENVERANCKMSEANDLMNEAHKAHKEANTLLNGTCYSYGNYGNTGFEDKFQKNDPNFLTDFTRQTKKRIWGQILTMANFEYLMDATEKEKFRSDISSMEVEPTLENIEATLNTLYAKSGEIFKRGIANCFSNLDRRFKSHDGFKIGSRVIIDQAFGRYGTSVRTGRTGDALRDIQKTFLILDNQALDGISITKEMENSQPHYELQQSVVQNEYFKISIFKNGNAHIYFLRDDLLETVNKMLAEHYGENLGEGHSAKEEEVFGNAGKIIKTARNFGFFPTPDAVVQKLIGDIYIRDEEAPTALEPSAGTGQLSKEMVKQGLIVDCVEIQTGLANELENQHIYNRVMNIDFLTLDPKIHTKKYDYVFMNPPFDRGLDMEHIVHAVKFLKPGGKLKAVMSASIEFRGDKKSIAFRKMIKDSQSWGNGIADLPPCSFAETGTNVNTCIVSYSKEEVS